MRGVVDIEAGDILSWRCQGLQIAAPRIGKPELVLYRSGYQEECERARIGQPPQIRDQRALSVGTLAKLEKWLGNLPVFGVIHEASKSLQFVNPNFIFQEIFLEQSV